MSESFALIAASSAGCAQLVSWYERPARCVPLDVEERVSGLRRLQIVNAVVFERKLLSGVLLLLQLLPLVVSVCGSVRGRINGQRSAADRTSLSLVVARRLSEEVQLVPVLNEVLPLAQHTCSFAPRLFWNARGKCCPWRQAERIAESAQRFAR